MKERLCQYDVYRLADLQGDIFNVSQGARYVTKYFAHLQGLWDEYTELNPLLVCDCDGCVCNVGATMRKTHEYNQVICFLRVLNKSFSTFKSHIMLMDPIPSMNKVFSLLLQFESQFLDEDKELDVVQEVVAFAQNNIARSF